MAATDFSNTWNATSQDKIYAATFNSMQAGIQAEFENRTEIAAYAGVISGLAASIDGADIDIASGEGYGLGLKYAGGGSITISGAAATYYVYWDASAEALAKSTSAPDTTDDILFCSVAWDGSTTLSGLVDLRPWGIVPVPIISATWSLGTVATGIIGGTAAMVPVWIDSVEMFLSDNGSSGSTIVDVNVGNSGGAPTTIFAATERRPSCDNAVTNYTRVSSGVPDTSRLVTAGQLITVEVDSAATGAQNLIVTVWGRMLI